MEYQKEFFLKKDILKCVLDFVTSESITWKIDFYYCGYTWLWLMLVQLLHLIPERFLILFQHAQECIIGIYVKWRKHYVALLVLVPNLKEDQSAVVLVVHQALEAVSAVRCQERNEINNHRKEIRDGHSREFLSFVPTNLFFKEFETNHQLLRPHFLKKMIYLADHRPGENSDDYTESELWFYLLCDKIISSAKFVHTCWITYLFGSAPNLPHSSVCFRIKAVKTR